MTPLTSFVVTKRLRYANGPHVFHHFGHRATESTIPAHRAADLLVDVFLRYRDQGKYLIHDFVIMPDHFHALITPAPEISLERAVQFIKGGFSFRLKSSLPVWQASFTNHRIRDDEDFVRHREYIRMNPVRAGLVRKQEDYPHSSATGQFALDSMPQGLKPSLDCHQTPA